jgi:hypothetical protein
MSCLVINLHGMVCGWSLSHFHWEHGWPQTFLYRDWWLTEMEATRPLGLSHPSWPWVTFPGQHYSLDALPVVVDITTLGILCVGTYFAFPGSTARRGRFQFTLTTLLGMQAALFLAFHLIANYPDAMECVAWSGAFLGVACSVFASGRALYRIPSQVRGLSKDASRRGSAR